MSHVKYYAYQYNMTGWKVQPVMERVGQCSKPDQMRSISKRYDVSVAGCCIFIPILWSNKRKKKKKTFSVGRSNCGKRNRPPASNTRTCPRARLGQLSRNEATGQVDARDGICTLGTPAECILCVADVKRLKGSETSLVYLDAHSVLHPPSKFF